MTNGSSQKTLIILNDPPYGSERSYNGLRLAIALSKDEASEVKMFLMGDAVSCGKAGQQTPQGYYNIERMIAACSRRQVEVGACGTCMDARGLAQEALAGGVHQSSMDELASWTRWADKVVVF